MGKMVKKLLLFIGILLFMGVFPASFEQLNYGKIAFISDRDNFGDQLYIMNGNGTQLMRGNK